MSADTSDLSLVQRVQRGDKSAFDVLVRKYQHKVVKLVMRYMRDPSDAEDVAQDTLVRAYRALVTYPPERVRQLKQRAWLQRIALNVTRNRHRGLRPRLVELDGSERDASPGPEARAVRHAEVQGVAARLACLPPRYREAVALRFVQELTYAEAAEVLGRPIGTVKSDVHRALQLLKGEVDDLADD